MQLHDMVLYNHCVCRSSRARKHVESEELAKKRKRNQGKRKTTNDDERLKNFQCKRFKQGLCMLGDTCKYSHCSQETNRNDDEEHVRSELISDTQPKYESQSLSQFTDFEAT